MCIVCVHPFLGGGGKMLVVNTHTHTCPFRPSSSLNGEHPVSHEAGNSHTLLMLDLNFFLLVSKKKKKASDILSHLSCQVAEF